MSLRPLVLALATAMLLAALAACGDDDPTPRAAEPPIESTTSPTTEPTADPPAPETAQQFIRRYSQADTAMQTQAKFDEYLALTDHCQPCVDLVSIIRGNYRRGGFVKWDGWRIRSIRLNHNLGPNYWLVSVESSPTTYKTSRNSAVRRFPGGPVTYSLQLRRVVNHWRVSDVLKEARS